MMKLPEMFRLLTSKNVTRKNYKNLMVKNVMDKNYFRILAMGARTVHAVSQTHYI